MNEYVFGIKTIRQKSQKPPANLGLNANQYIQGTLIRKTIIVWVNTFAAVVVF